MAKLGKTTMIGVAAALALSLGSCREEEQHRQVMYEPGVYKGKPDTPLSAEARQALRARIRGQNALAGGLSRPGGGAPGATPPSVRPPAGAVGGGAALDTLRRRGTQQKFN